MDSYLYYKRGAEWVRVKASKYTRETVPSQGGQCVGQQYIVTWSVTSKYYPAFYDGRQYTNNRTRIVDGGNWKGPMRAKATPDTHVGTRYANDQPDVSFYEMEANKGEILSIFNVKVVPRYPETYVPCAADSGGSCSTKFSLNGQTVLMLASCPQVTDGRGCSECCGELLAIAKQMQV